MASSFELRPSQAAVENADELSRAGETSRAIESYLAAAAQTEIPPASLCLKLAKAYLQLKENGEALRWALKVTDTEEGYTAWNSAAAIAQRFCAETLRSDRRTARVSVCGSYTLSQFCRMLQLSARRQGVRLEIHESPYGTYRQEILDPASALYAFKPQFVVIAAHEGELSLPEWSASSADEVDRELNRWTSLWEAVARNSNARVIQHNFAIRAEQPAGHLGSRLDASRYWMSRELNQRLGAAAGNSVSIVDCDRLSSVFGKGRWCDPRYWHLAKQAVALDALPLLARHTAAVMAADLGLSRKCLVLDLDNTLWGGVVGEEGLAGIKLGGGVEGEAFVALQEYILQLKRKGVILAVCSKNNEADAREPFLKHPEMRIRQDDIAMFVANWQTKPENLRNIAQTLDIGLDSLVLLDDNPIERAAVRQLVPEVDVIPLPADPCLYVRALSEYLLFETSSFTAEDMERTRQYQARAKAAEMRANADSLEGFLHGLRMEATVAPFDNLHLPRVAQLVGKTNQFNLTTRRHTIEQLRSFKDDPECVHFHVRLKDCFADHGLIGVMIARRCETAMEIDTWLMSCRVIGRTVENMMFDVLSGQARSFGCTEIRGTYTPTGKNAVVSDLYSKLGFEPAAGMPNTWIFRLGPTPASANSFIRVVSPGGDDALA